MGEGEGGAEFGALRCTIGKGGSKRGLYDREGGLYVNMKEIG